MLPEFADKIKIFAGDVVAAKKPDPVTRAEAGRLSDAVAGYSCLAWIFRAMLSQAIYKLAAKELGVAPMRCVVVEDTGIGAQAGSAASMKAGTEKRPQ